MASMVWRTVCSVRGIPEFHEFQPIGGSMADLPGALQAAATALRQHTRIRSRRTTSASHRFLAVTVSACVASSGGVGPQQRAAAAVIGREFEMPDLVGVDLAQPERGSVAHEPVVGARGPDV